MNFMQGLEIKINVIRRERGKKLQNRPFLSSLILRRLRSFGVPQTSENRDNFWVAPSFCFIAKLKWKAVHIKMTFEECFHMRSWRPYWCPKTMKRQWNNDTFWVELFSYANALFCSNEFVDILAMWVKTLYSHANIIILFSQERFHT